MKTKTMLILFFIFLASILLADQTSPYAKGTFMPFQDNGIGASKININDHSNPAQTIWNEDFEKKSNWTSQGSWKVTELNNISQKSNGKNCLTSNPQNILSNQNQSSITSSTISLPKAPYIELTFQESFAFESDYDFGYIEVLCDNQSYLLDIRTGTTNQNWISSSFDLTQFSGKNIRLNFRVSTDESVQSPGWMIDQMMIRTQDNPQTILQITNLDYSCYPSIYANALVKNNNGFITDLTTENFQLTENGVVQTNEFTVMTPSSNRSRALIDIVFLLDLTGSMATEVNIVKNNMVTLINQMITDHVDFNIGFGGVGDTYRLLNSNAQPTFFDSTNVQGMQTAFNQLNLGAFGIGTGGDWKENQIGAMADAALFPWRTGSTRLMILLTDATPHQGDNITTWTAGSLISSRLNPNNINAIILCDGHHTDQNQIYGAIASATGGSLHHIYSSILFVMNLIPEESRSLYTVHYKTNEDLNDLSEKNVVLSVSDYGRTYTATKNWTPFSYPSITRTTETIQKDLIAQSANTSCVLSINVKDMVMPYEQDVVLYFRQIGDIEFQQARMIQNDADNYSATIPAQYMNGRGIEYYFSAFDGQVLKTLPINYPQLFPFTLALSPYQKDSITILNQPSFTNNNLTINASVNIDNNSRLVLFYRKLGKLSYERVEMTITNGNIFQGAIAHEDAENQIEYFIKAINSQEIASYYGSFDKPVRLNVQPNIQLQPAPSAVNLSAVKSYPNPINLHSNAKSTATISFNINKTSQVTAKVYNIKGELVKTLASKSFDKGNHNLSWDVKDQQGKNISSGIYFYVIETDQQKTASKVLIIK